MQHVAQLLKVHFATQDPFPAPESWEEAVEQLKSEDSGIRSHVLIIDRKIADAYNLVKAPNLAEMRKNYDRVKMLLTKSAFHFKYLEALNQFDEGNMIHAGCVESARSNEAIIDHAKEDELKHGYELMQLKLGAARQAEESSDDLDSNDIIDIAYPDSTIGTGDGDQFSSEDEGRPLLLAHTQSGGPSGVLSQGNPDAATGSSSPSGSTI
ncbi:hypothetical protein C8T65DRAFT_694717 [Cerioporus squamosus]|nr:hypothetical protein C8T65DRAFT_699430 [Cerioporus squamosus]KAI0715448.1 hypothetical protein C8T65DRAFT_694717 [Cerioporus squamosus]